MGENACFPLWLQSSSIFLLQHIVASGTEALQLLFPQKLQYYIFFPTESELT